MHKLQAERDAAFQLAEELEAKLRQNYEELEEQMQKGYEEAFQMLQSEKMQRAAAEEKVMQLEEKLKESQTRNDRLSETAGGKKYIETLEAEFLQKKNELEKETNDILANAKRGMAEVLDLYLKSYLKETEDELRIKKIKELMAKGGETLVKEAFGEDGVKLMNVIKEIQDLMKDKEIVDEISLPTIHTAVKPYNTGPLTYPKTKAIFGGGAKAMFGGAYCPKAILDEAALDKAKKGSDLHIKPTLQEEVEKRANALLEQWEARK
jgi:hypothetical protein